MMKVYIRKDHILSRHFNHMNDDSAGIFYSEEGSGLAWLWDSIQYIVRLFVNNNKKFRRLGGQAYNSHQRRILLEMPMPSVVGLTRGPSRHECTGVLIVYDRWQKLVVTAYPCTPLATSTVMTTEQQPDVSDLKMC
jgi:hypothetical protein